MSPKIDGSAKVIDVSNREHLQEPNWRSETFQVPKTVPKNCQRVYENIVKRLRAAGAGEAGRDLSTREDKLEDAIK